MRLDTNRLENKEKKVCIIKHNKSICE